MYGDQILINMPHSVSQWLDLTIYSFLKLLQAIMCGRQPLILCLDLFYWFLCNFHILFHLFGLGH